MTPCTLYLCPSDRSARAFQAKLAARDVAPPDCVDIERFCRALWQRGQLFGLIADTREIVDSTASAALWRYIVAQETDLSDSEIGRVATLASDAWTLAHRYALSINSLASLTTGTDNLALFARCAQRMQSLLKRHGGVTQPELASNLNPMLDRLQSLLPSTIVITPAFNLCPAQARLLSQLSEQGVQVTAWSEPADQTTLPDVYRFADETQEMRAAIAWAAKLAEDAAGTVQGAIAIVVPDLSSRRDVWLAALREQLNPDQWWLDPETDRDQFNLSVGLALSEYPHIASLLTVLRATLADVDTELTAQALAHPRWGRKTASLAQLERHQWTLLERGIDRSTINDWCEVLPSAVALLVKRDNADKRAARSTHATTILDATRAFTEHAMIAQSDLFQLDETWTNAIQGWTESDRWLPAITWRQAIGEIVQLANEQTFQPRAGTARIQVMGLLEAAGVPFAAAWITGFTDRVLPESFKPNPMLPRAWQTTHHVGLGSRDEIRRRANALWTNWNKLSGSLIVSFAGEIETGEQRISPLAEALHVQDHAAIVATRSAPDRVISKHADEALPAVKDNAQSEPRTLSAGDIERQAHCPRKATAAFLRLHEWPEHVVGIPPRVRGTLVHEVMAAIGDARMRGVNEGPGEPDAALLRAVAAEAFTGAASTEAAKRPRIPVAVWELERARLLPLIDQVLLLDAARNGFRVIAVEEEVKATLFNSAFKLRVDRVDDFAAANNDDDRFGVVIDYKTGSAARSDWFAENTSDRLAAPQLPLYLFALHAIMPAAAPRMGALGYIIISDDDVKFVGLGADPAFSTKKTAKDEPEWFDLTMQWKDQLTHLVNEVHAGVADVAPLKGRATCRNCRLNAFCREPWSLSGSGAVESDDSIAEAGGA